MGIAKKSKLAPIAKKVSEYLRKYFKEFRKANDVLDGDTIVFRVNNFIEDILAGFNALVI